MKSDGKIKWGIIGCGNIARKFAGDLALIPEAELTAVASRNIDKAEIFRKENGGKKAYGSYRELISDQDVDIIYIATPHISHAKWSIAALENGKHVLCEKPFAMNRNEGEAVAAASKQTGKFFMEALWSRFIPTVTRVKEIHEQGGLGEIRYINADFTFKSDKPLNSRVLDLSLGGGALLDIGIYPAFLSYLLLGVPEKILATSIFHEKTGCDIQTSMIFQYEKAQATLYCGFASQSDMLASVSGTKGQIYFGHPWFTPDGFSWVKNDEKQHFDLPKKGMGFTYEIEECHRCIRSGRYESSLWTHTNSLDLIGILDRVRSKTGLVYPKEKT